MSTNDEDRIDQLPIGRSWFNGLLQRAFKTGDVEKALKSVRGIRIDEGRGYLSLMAKMTLEWSNVNSSLPNRLILKLPTAAKYYDISVSIRAELGEEPISDQSATTFDDFIVYAHETECRSYDLFDKNKLYLQASVPVPLCYHWQPFSKGEPGLLLLEDLSAIGRTRDLADGLTYEQALSIFRSLAALHAFSIKERPDWNAAAQFRRLERSDWPDLENETRTALEAIRKSYPSTDDFDVSEEDCKRLANTDAFFDSLDPATNGGFHAVIVHGDMWSNNVMFKTIDGDKNMFSDEVAGFIDWQTTHPGPCTEDFARLLVSSVDHELRRERTGDLLRDYYGTLQRLLHPLTVPFSFADIERLFKRMLLPATTIFIVHLAVILGTEAASGSYSAETKQRLLKRLEAAIKDTLS